MKAVPAKTKKGGTVFIVEIEPGDRLNDTDSQGMCIACGEFADGVEPDARRYECDACNQPKVYGIEQLFVMGYCREVQP